MKGLRKLPWAIVSICRVLILPVPALAAEEGERFDARFQSTYVYQAKPAFDSPYSGPRSLRGEKERSYTLTATAFLGARPWSGGELYFNPEVVRGRALSNVTGLGGLTNGELQKTAGPEFRLYRARLFLRQTWGLGGEKESVESDANQLGGSVDSRRLVLTAGNFSLLDVFAKSEYAGDPRTQFMNWSFLAHGAFDYAADLRGYSWGAALEYYSGDWALRAARMELPKRPNSMALDHRVFSTYGDQAELERRHRLGGRPGKVQLLAFRNVAAMTSYADALAVAAATATTPTLTSAPREQSKVGFGIAAEQELAPGVGAFARASRHDGKTETYAFADIDSTISAGTLVRGGRWGRGEDTLGVALARNGISSSHRAFLAAGGSTFFLGDGRLAYRPETIFETFYSIAVGKHLSVSADWQHIRNPGYNADRGPADIGSLRLHVEF